MQQTVIVTLSCFYADGSKSYDLEIPCDVPARLLTGHIYQTLRNYTGSTIKPASAVPALYSRRLERKLSPEESLGQAGIRSGDYLDLK